MVSSGNVLEDPDVPGITSVAFEVATLKARRELVAAARRAGRHERTLLAPPEALNALTVGAAPVDLAPEGWAPRPGEVAIQDDDEPSPAISAAHGPGPFGAIKPDLPASGGRHEVRTIAVSDNLQLRVKQETGRSGVFVAAVRAGAGELERARGVESRGRADRGGWFVCGVDPTRALRGAPAGVPDSAKAPGWPELLPRVHSVAGAHMRAGCHASLSAGRRRRCRRVRPVAAGTGYRVPPRLSTASAGWRR